LDEIPETRGFVLFESLSTREASVFVNQTTKEVCVSYRGTASLRDVGTDLLILTSTTGLSARLRESFALMERVLHRFPGFKVTTAGHSLGAFLGNHVASRFQLESHAFNAAESVVGTLRPSNELSFNYRTHFDPVSVLTRNSIRVQPRLGNEHTPESVHRLNNFFDKNAKRVVRNGEEGFVSIKSTKLQEHIGQVGFLADAAFVAYDIRQFYKKKNTLLGTLDNIITKDIMMPNPTQLVLDSPDTSDLLETFAQEERDRQDRLDRARRFEETMKSMRLVQVMGQGFTPPIVRRVERRTRFSTAQNV
jgi:hypothetical protein